MTAAGAAIERDRALAIQQRGMRDWIAMLGGSAPDSRFLELDGTAAAVVPAVPDRSIANSVNYSDAGALAESLDQLTAAYGFAAGEGMAALFAQQPEDLDLRIYRARLDGESASVLATIDHEPLDGAGGGDCGIYFVATHEAARGRGLATRLLTAALGEARDRGCATSSLQSSAMGEPIYVARGYQPCFRLHMYERRKPA